jgi:hypothetical protein
MANQNVGTPRFYIDHLQYIRAIGMGYPQVGEDIFNLNPSSFLGNKPLSNETNYWDFGFFPQDDDESGDSQDEALLIPNVNYGKLNYIAILGHNLGTVMQGSLDVNFRDNIAYGSSGDVALSNLNLVEVVNLPSHTSIPLDGFSIATFDDYIFSGINLFFSLNDTGLTDNKIGSLSLGGYYDMPHSADISLSLTHGYEGISKQETIGGSTLSQTNYYKPPRWGGLDAWALSGWLHSYSGRRVWELSFNYLSDKDLEPYHYNMDRGMGEIAYNKLGENPNWNDDGNWFTNVLYFTNGGQLPFIFCPDPSITYSTDTWTKPEFAICRFDMETFKREQVANGVYNMKVKIKESW